MCFATTEMVEAKLIEAAKLAHQFVEAHQVDEVLKRAKAEDKKKKEAAEVAKRPAKKEVSGGWFSKGTKMSTVVEESDAESSSVEKEEALVMVVGAEPIELLRNAKDNMFMCELLMGSCEKQMTPLMEAATHGPKPFYCTVPHCLLSCLLHSPTPPVIYYTGCASQMLLFSELC